MPLEDADMIHEMTTALGEAVVKCWSEFPPAVQQKLFEAAVRDENGFRGALALFLHDHNPQTADYETTDLPPDEEENLPPHFPPGRPHNREPRR